MDLITQLEQGRYGSFELKHFVGRNLFRGLVVSFLIHSVVVASPYIMTLFKSDIPEPDRVIVIDPSQLTKLKRQQQENVETVKIERPKIAPPKAAIPVAVEEDEVIEEPQLIASQEEIIAAVSGDDEGLEIDPNATVVIQEEKDEAIPGSDVFTPYEVAPQPLPDFMPQPAFPEMAKLAQVTGKVVAQVYVDKKGEVKKYKIVKVDPKDLGFEDEVEKIIMKWKFTPAIQQGNPVGVWIAIPFNFKYKK
ncbi:TonB family protein [candidate division KSB1 bacterium]|nr:TonB family protein [candidate division KSB1 bacterium]